MMFMRARNSDNSSPYGPPNYSGFIQVNHRFQPTMWGEPRRLPFGKLGTCSRLTSVGLVLFFLDTIRVWVFDSVFFFNTIWVC